MLTFSFVPMLTSNILLEQNKKLPDFILLTLTELLLLQK